MVPLTCILLLLSVTATFAAVGERKECVVLLHGLSRSSESMSKLGEAINESGFDVVNVSYPSRELPIEDLASLAVAQGLGACEPADTVHFVTHSLGGILVRIYFLDQNSENLGRVVMLAPPNQGSEVVDTFKELPGFDLIYGPAGMQLGTDEDSLPNQLGSVNFELGIIAGNKSINPLLSQFLPNPDDGKVSVARTKVDGLADFIVVPESHTFIMRSNEVIEQTIAFLRTGSFTRSAIVSDEPQP